MKITVTPLEVENKAGESDAETGKSKPTESERDPSQ